MGLDVTHDCWHGSYGSFNAFREDIARAIGVPLELMEGFYREDRLDSLFMNDMKLPYVAESTELYITQWLPIDWEVLKPDPIYILLHHSDCDGTIEIKDLLPIAERLETIAPLLGDGTGKVKWNMQEKALKFAAGLREAFSLNEVVEFM